MKTLILAALMLACSSAEVPTEDVGSVEQAIPECAAPLNYRHTLTDTVMFWNIPNNPAVCPSAWYQSTDPFRWRVGLNPPAPSVPSGQCWWTAPVQWPADGSSCRIKYSFQCPTGIHYEATVYANNIGGNYDWGKSLVWIVGEDPECQRAMFGTFRVTP